MYSPEILYVPFVVYVSDKLADGCTLIFTVPPLNSPVMVFVPFVVYVLDNVFDGCTSTVISAPLKTLPGVGS